MGLARKSKAHSLTQTRLVGIRVQTSLNGRPIALVYGSGRVPANLIWYGDFVAQTQQQQSGGKGMLGGGGKGSPKSYVYYAAIAAGLCEGPIYGLGHVWDSQGALLLSSNSENYTVPGGGGTFTPSPPSGGSHRLDLGVGRADSYSVGPFTDYGSPGPVTLSGTQQTPMTPVPGAPTGAGTYTLNPSTGQYTFHAADAGKVMSITYYYSVPNSGGNGNPATTLSLTLFFGNRPQTPWSYLTSKHPGQDLAYGGLAYVCNSSLFLGSSGQLPNLSYEIFGFNPFGAGIPDCDPSVVLKDILTSSVYGAGFSSSNIASWANYSAYCVANGLLLSFVIDSHETCASIIDRVMKITNSEAVWTGSTLKIIPYGDTTVVGNGVTFTPNTAPIYDLNDDDFISPDSGEPVQLKIGTVIDAYNSVKVEYLDRANQYNASIVEAKDDASISLYGLRPRDPESWHEITTQKVAALASDLLLRRTVYVRNIYSFVLGWRYGLLEPMDMVTITDSYLGLNKAPVRIMSISEDKDGNLAIEAEEFPWGTAQPTLYPKEINTGFIPTSVADPGNVNTPVMFEALSRLNDQIGHAVWMGVSGANPAWGGCTVWASTDGSTYKAVGKIYDRARMGVLTAILPNTADPDTTDTLSVDLTQSLAALLSGTAADCDNFITLCYVDGELISYQVATLTSAYHYNLATRLRRGIFNSVRSSHAIGSQFLRVDSAVFTWDYDATLIGTTVYFKFTSFNISQNMEQSLANATAYTFAITGASLGLLTPAHVTYRPTTNPLTAHDAGASATINIASFSMRVPGIPDIAVNSGSFAALGYNTLYYVFYDDPGFAGGNVSYQVATVKETALNGAGRFFVGSITTPRAGAPDTVGNNDGGSGAQNGMLNVYSMSVASQAVSGNGAIANLSNALDSDMTTFASFTTTGNGAVNNAQIFLSGPAALNRRYNSATLKIRYSVPTNNLSPAFGTTVFQVLYSSTGLGGVFTTLVALNDGQTTAGILTASVALPQGTNLSQIAVLVQCSEGIIFTGGSVVGRIYEAWIEAIE